MESRTQWEPHPESPALRWFHGAAARRPLCPYRPRCQRPTNLCRACVVTSTTSAKLIGGSSPQAMFQPHVSMKRANHPSGCPVGLAVTDDTACGMLARSRPMPIERFATPRPAPATRRNGRSRCAFLRRLDAGEPAGPACDTASACHSSGAPVRSVRISADGSICDAKCGSSLPAISQRIGLWAMLAAVGGRALDHKQIERLCSSLI